MSEALCELACIYPEAEQHAVVWVGTLGTRAIWAQELDSGRHEADRAKTLSQDVCLEVLGGEAWTARQECDDLRAHHGLFVDLLAPQLDVLTVRWIREHTVVVGPPNAEAIDQARSSFDLKGLLPRRDAEHRGVCRIVRLRRGIQRDPTTEVLANRIQNLRRRNVDRTLTNEVVKVLTHLGHESLPRALPKPAPEHPTKRKDAAHEQPHAAHGRCRRLLVLGLITLDFGLLF